MADEKFKREVIRLAGPEVLTCIQCGTCSASCPTAHLMKPSIRRLMKLILEGKEDEALRSNSIWLCTSCQLCTVRCPRGIRPKAVVGALKEIAEKEGIKGKDQAYDEAFQRQIKECGRISELPLTGEFILIEPKAAVQAMEMGIEMAPRGKISLERELVKRPEEVKRIIEELGK
ncbi:MAG: 4Fe-4S dicluster domain-containing protein [Methanotrichaceae archaeon]